MTAVHRYVARPTTVTEAIEWDGHIVDLPTEWLTSGLFAFTPDDGDTLTVNTLGGWRPVEVGDFIVRGAAGDFFALTPDTFHTTYVEVLP